MELPLETAYVPTLSSLPIDLKSKDPVCRLLFLTSFLTSIPSAEQIDNNSLSYKEKKSIPTLRLKGQTHNGWSSFLELKRPYSLSKAYFTMKYEFHRMIDSCVRGKARLTRGRI